MQKLKFTKYALSSTLVLGLLFGAVPFSYAASIGTDAASTAAQYVGRTITNYDSADFVSYVYAKEGKDLPSSLSQLSKEGKLILSQKSLEPGDIVFFGTSPKNLMAAGIYTENKQIIVAYKPYNTIKSLSLQSSVVQNYFLGAKRIDTSVTTPVVTKPSTTTIAEKVIEAGKKYLGTPYEYGSSRSNTRTFDCSDFVRQAFLDGAGISLPYSSRGQASYVKNLGHVTTDWHKLQPGDLMFFMAYKGWRESDYNGINVSGQTVNHVAIYLGNGKILHTYSKSSGGVRIDSIANTHWEYRFIFGGSAVK